MTTHPARVPRWLKYRKSRLRNRVPFPSPPPSDPASLRSASPTPGLSQSGDGARAVPSDPFFKRICKALGLSEQELIVLTQLPAHELATGRVVVHGNEAFERIMVYVNTRIGLLVAVREELLRKLARERQQRLKQRLKVEQR